LWLCFLWRNVIYCVQWNCGDIETGERLRNTWGAWRRFRLSQHSTTLFHNWLPLSYLKGTHKSPENHLKWSKLPHALISLFAQQIDPEVLFHHCMVNWGKERRQLRSSSFFLHSGSLLS